LSITVDTNVLVRIFVEDDLNQSRVAQAELRRAKAVAVTMPALCEFVWVLGSVYRVRKEAILRAIRSLLDTENVVADRPAAEAGLAVLEAGGDFANGAIAFIGREMGAPTFVSFDRSAVKMIEEAGGVARAPA
jgi:predicted nucleic-acid-binding protein